jgi:hypothetical protein
VKDLVSAFAENPKLPKVLRQKEILDTIDNGVKSGIFVAVRKRPDQSVSGTWWRTPIAEGARSDAALEVFLPEKAILTELDPSVLAPKALPDLWPGDCATVADVIAYFAGGRTVTVQRDGYEEQVVIPACPPAAVETAISNAVRRGILWLLNGPASFQGEPVPSGVLTANARLLAPMPPLSVERLTQEAVPQAWKDGQTNALALSIALSAHAGEPTPWTVLRRAIDDAIKARWVELAPESGPWPCEMVGASAVALKQPAAEGGAAERQPSGYVSKPKAVYTCSAGLEPSALQDLVDVLPAIVKAAAGVQLRFQLHVSLGDGQPVQSETVVSINKLFEEVSSDLCLRV